MFPKALLRLNASKVLTVTSEIRPLSRAMTLRDQLEKTTTLRDQLEKKLV